MAANRVTQMIDPWPAASGQRNIAYNGERCSGAAERYRTGRVVQPVSATTSSARLAAGAAAGAHDRRPCPIAAAAELAIGAGSSPIK